MCRISEWQAGIDAKRSVYLFAEGDEGRNVLGQHLVLVSVKLSVGVNEEHLSGMQVAKFGRSSGGH